MAKQTIGNVSVAPQVLSAVASAAALSVPGIVRLSTYRPLTMERLLRRVVIEPGVTLAIEESGVTFDLYLVFSRGVSLVDVSRSVQAEVARAIRETLGMTVLEVNIHVDDIAGAAANSD